MKSLPFLSKKVYKRINYGNLTLGQNIPLFVYLFYLDSGCHVSMHLALVTLQDPEA